MKNRTGISLREGLDRYLEENASVSSDREVSSEAQEFFRCHDAAHVVFGCDTTLFGEGILKIFTIFRTTLGFRGHLSGYAEAGAFDLFRQYRLGHVMGNTFLLSVNIPSAVVRARKMSRPWPWADHEQYLDASVEEIRKEFNIKVLQRA